MNGKQSFAVRVRKDFKRNRSLYLLVLPVIIFYILFCYKPMGGIIIAFKNYRPAEGILGSAWVGLDNFTRYFNSPYFVRTVRNTLVLNLMNVVFTFPAPIILALLLNELKGKRFKKLTQTITYMPHFISMVVIAGMIIEFTSSNGVINDLIEALGGTRSPLLQNPNMFRPIYIISEIWQTIGWNSIIYLSALAGVDEQLYEAAMIDGAGRFRRIISVTLPGIASTIIVLLIMKIGSLMSIGYEKIMLLYTPATYDTADVISTYAYRVGILETSFSYSTAITMFSNVINFAFLMIANTISRRVNETSLW